MTTTSCASPLSELDTRAVARLRLAVLRLQRQIRQHAKTGVTPSQLSALSTLDRHGPLQPAQLAEHEQIGRSTVTRLARHLETAGLVARRADPADGRCAILELTDAGHELLRASRSRADAFLARRVAALDDADRALIGELADLLERLAVAP